MNGDDPQNEEIMEIQEALGDLYDQVQCPKQFKQDTLEKLKYIEKANKQGKAFDSAYEPEEMEGFYSRQRQIRPAVRRTVIAAAFVAVVLLFVVFPQRKGPKEATQAVMEPKEPSMEKVECEQKNQPKEMNRSDAAEKQVEISETNQQAVRYLNQVTTPEQKKLFAHIFDKMSVVLTNKYSYGILAESKIGQNYCVICYGSSFQSSTDQKAKNEMALLRLDADNFSEHGDSIHLPMNPYMGFCVQPATRGGISVFDLKYVNLATKDHGMYYMTEDGWIADDAAQILTLSYDLSEAYLRADSEKVNKLVVMEPSVEYPASYTFDHLTSFELHLNSEVKAADESYQAVCDYSVEESERVAHIQIDLIKEDGKWKIQTFCAEQ